MKYDHAVIYDGKFYAAGENVPDGKKAEADVEEKASAPVIEEPMAEKKQVGRPKKREED